MSLKFSYTLLAPLYDTLVESPTRHLREKSLAQLSPSSRNVLLAGIGSGLDIPFLPAGKNYYGIDITPAMLRKATQQCRNRTDIELVCGDVQNMPCPDQQFDSVVLHLILAVVPEPEKLIREVVRVLKPGGQVLVVDKFLRPHEWAPLRRFLNLFIRHIATRTDVVFESLLATCPELEVVHDQPAVLGGWFRQIELRKN